jgi:hypothetical protein
VVFDQAARLIPDSGSAGAAGITVQRPAASDAGHR